MATKEKKIGSVTAAMMISVAVLIDTLQIIFTIFTFIPLSALSLISLSFLFDDFATQAAFIFAGVIGSIPVVGGLFLILSWLLSLLALLIFLTWFMLHGIYFSKTGLAQLGVFWGGFLIEFIPVAGGIPIISGVVIATIALSRVGDKLSNKKKKQNKFDTYSYEGSFS